MLNLFKDLNKGSIIYTYKIHGIIKDRIVKDVLHNTIFDNCVKLIFDDYDPVIILKDNCIGVDYYDSYDGLIYSTSKEELINFITPIQKYTKQEKKDLLKNRKLVTINYYESFDEVRYKGIENNCLNTLLDLKHLQIINNRIYTQEYDFDKSLEENEIYCKGIITNINYSIYNSKGIMLRNNYDYKKLSNHDKNLIRQFYIKHQELQIIFKYLNIII